MQESGRISRYPWGRTHSALEPRLLRRIDHDRGPRNGEGGGSRGRSCRRRIGPASGRRPRRGCASCSTASPPTCPSHRRPAPITPAPRATPPCGRTASPAPRGRARGRLFLMPPPVALGCVGESGGVGCVRAAPGVPHPPTLRLGIRRSSSGPRAGTQVPAAAPAACESESESGRILRAARRGAARRGAARRCSVSVTGATLCPGEQMGEEALGGGGAPAHAARRNAAAGEPGEARMAGGAGPGGGPAPSPRAPAPPQERLLAPPAAGGFALRAPLEGGRGYSGPAAAAASPRYRADGPGSDAESLRDVPGTQV